MRPVTDQLLRSLRGSHVMRSRARVVPAGTTGTNPDGTTVPVVGGSVSFEATVSGETYVQGASIRSTLDLTTSAAWPGSTTDALAPFGNELFVERGLAFGNGVVEWVSQGYHRIYTVEQDNPPDGPVRIDAKDRMSGLEDARLTSPRQFAGSPTLGSIVTTLVQEVYPTAVIEWDDLTYAQTLGRGLIAEEDRYGFLADLITAAGKVWGWDYRGHLVIKSPPDPSAPVYDVNAGRDGVLVAMSRDLSREGVYNAVVASGEAADTEPPKRAVAYDNNSSSPTYYNGPFGKVPRFYTSPFITTTAQAWTAAESILRQSLGVPYNVNFGAVPNPALEVLDAVRVRYPVRSRSARLEDEIHLIQTLTIPLDPQSAMTAVTREQQLVQLGVS